MFAVPPNTVARPSTHATAHPVRLARALAENRESWRHLLRYDPDRRWLTLVERGAAHEIWLMSWLPGQRTELHDHGGATGAFTVVSGTLSERVVRPGATASETWLSLVAGQSRAFGPHYVHQVRNDGVDPAVSIHVYRPGRAPMNIHP